MEYKGISAAVVALLTMIAIGASLVPVAGTHDADVDLVAPSPAEIKPNTRVLVTVKVTNTGSDENINDVRVTISGFTEAIAGPKSGENLKLAADNWALAFENFARAGDNLVIAEDLKMHAGELIASDADHLMDAAHSALFLSWENVAVHVEDAAFYLGQAGDNLNLSTENIVLIENLMIKAGIELMFAGGTGLIMPPPYENIGRYNPRAGENMSIAGYFLAMSGVSLSMGDLRYAGQYLENAGVWMENAGILLKDNSASAGGYVESAGVSLQKAGDNLIAAANYKDNAGLVLIATAGYLKIAGSYIENADADLGSAGDNVQFAAACLENAGTALSGSPENIFAAGENLYLAATSLATAADELGKVLGEDELEDAIENLLAAAEYLRHDNRLKITAAGEALIGAASDFALVDDEIRDIGDTLVSDPGAGWNFDGTNKFDGAVGENTIAPGKSLNFSILLKSPNITTEKKYDIVVVTRDTTGIGFVTTTLQDALTVDGKLPGLTVVVTQATVGVDDIVGVIKDNGKATVTVTATETLSKLGKVRVEIENADGLRENILVVTMSTTDNVEWTGEFSVGYWDDNTPEIEIAGCKDEVGNENEESPQHSFRVDTRAPMFLDNGFPAALANYTMIIGCVDNVWITTENDVWVIYGQVLENGGSPFSVYVDSVVASIDPSDNSFSGTLNLGSDGLKSIIVRAVDVLGNENSDNVENILLDTQEPTIDLVKFAGETFNWPADNDKWIRDNTPAMELSILDPGYPGTGLGVHYELICVDLYNAWGGWLVTIENSNLWDPLDGSYDNDGITRGGGLELVDGARYYIGVRASDNFPGRMASENFWFRVDVSPPDIDDLIDATDIMDPETGLPLFSGAITNEDTLKIEGTSDEPGSTVHVYVDNTEYTVESDETDGSFSLTIDLEEGINKIYVKEVDRAGNVSEKKLLASITADWTPPVISNVEPASGTSTDEVSVTVSGKVTDGVAEYDELVVRLDATGAFVAKVVYLNPDGSFSTTIPLVEGTNVITVYAQDLAGNQKIFSITVDRSVTSWYLYFMIVAIVIVILAAIAVLKRS
jgi:hypothetical protein